jgi:uncharacterized membrane protein YfcA
MAIEILVFLLISVLLSMVGIGGGIFYVPIFLFLGYTFQAASTTSLFLISITGFSAFLRYRKAKMVDWQLALMLETFTDIGAFAGGATSVHFHPQLLKLSLGILLLIAAYFTMQSKKDSAVQPTLKTGFGRWHRHFNGYDYSLSLPLIIPLTFSIGYFSGLLGIAGGVFKIPIMILWFGIPAKIAIATSALMVSLTGLLGLGGHLLHTSLNWETALILGVIVFIGGQIGSRISLKLPEKKVKKVLAAILMIIAVYLIAKSLL